MMSRSPVLVALALAGCAVDASAPQPAELASAWVERNAAARGFDLEASRIEVERVRVSPRTGRTHVRLQQTVDDVPVLGGQLIVHLDDGDGTDLTDAWVHDVEVDTTPRWTGDEALDIAQTAEGLVTGQLERSEVELFVWRDGAIPRLVWRVELVPSIASMLDSGLRPAQPMVFVDAHSGEIVRRYDNLHTASTVWSTGSSLYDGTVSIKTYKDGGTLYLEDPTRSVGTYDGRSSASVPHFTDSDTTWTGPGQKAGVSVHYGLRHVYDLFYGLGVDGMDGSGGPGHYTLANSSVPLITAVAHVGTSWNGASWNGSYMSFGDGDGSLYEPLVSVDIVGHEYTHGVIDAAGGLEYDDEPGALNEAIADIFGTLTELRADPHGDWLIGEDVVVSGVPMRDLADPSSVGDPDHYLDYVDPSMCSDGCVHTNSSIVNNMFYLLAEGGTHRKSGRTLKGIGTEDASAILLEALTSYFTYTTSFRLARRGMVKAAGDLYGAGSYQQDAVKEAWAAVGVK